MSAATYTDHRIADEVADARAYSCQARGCPRAWSIDIGGAKVCSAHAGAMPREWPAITERIVWEDGERARTVGAAPPERERGPLARACTRPTPEQLAAIQAQRATMGDHSARQKALAAWLALRERERAREHLTRFQADAWRIGLKVDLHAGCWAPAWFEGPSG
jgi:hypothetical protein